MLLQLLPLGFPLQEGETQAAEVAVQQLAQAHGVVADDTLTTTLILQQTYRPTQAEAVIMHSENLPLTVFNMRTAVVAETERLKAVAEYIPQEVLEEQEDVQASGQQAE